MADIKRQFRVISDEDSGVFLKVAFATDDNKFVNQHFGSAKAIAIYGVNPESSHLITLAEFGDPDYPDNEDKLVHKLELLEDCVAIYCRACGSSAVRQLLDRNIQPLKITEDSAIKGLIKVFQQELIEGPSRWLAQAIRRQRSPKGFFDDEFSF